MDPSMLINMIIRPPRSSYPNVQSTATTTFTEVKNSRNEKIKLAHSKSSDVSKPCIVYMHGNAGNLMEGQSYAHILGPKGFGLVSFDFSGCGNSEGAFITLGWKEQEDLHAVLTYVKEQGYSKAILWGRSMGAATALLYGKEPPVPIVGLILDSSFACFKDVAISLATGMGIPPEFIQMLWP